MEDSLRLWQLEVKPPIQRRRQLFGPVARRSRCAIQELEWRAAPVARFKNLSGAQLPLRDLRTWGERVREVAYPLREQPMRIIGHVESEPAARTFSDYLYVKGIKNQVEAESDGTWAIWIHAEDELDQARNLLRGYLANPNDATVKHAAAKARELIEKEGQQEAAARKRHFDRDRLFPSGWRAHGPLTLSLIAISVVVYLIMNYSTAWEWTQYLFISNPAFSVNRDLPEVRQGQVWRLLTPIFLHFGILHILFNMLWLNDLGSMIEARLGTLHLLLMVVVIGVLSNVAQYYVSGPQFGGMSGVVYGLLGYVWMKGKFDPGSGLFLHPSTVMMMLIWLVFGFTNILPMANTVHAVGLSVGVAWGFAAAQARYK
jgi:rhomboid protease GlpG